MGACFSCLPAPTIQPFTELAFNEKQQTEMACCFQENRPFFVAMSRITKCHLIDIAKKQTWCTVPLKKGNNTYLRSDEATNNSLCANLKTSTQTWEKPFREAFQSQRSLSTSKFTCRLVKPVEGLADSWHVDHHPILLNCLATLNGPTTRYVSNAIKNDSTKFVPKTPGGYEYVAQADLNASDIQTMPESHFAIFPGEAIDHLQNDSLSVSAASQKFEAVPEEAEALLHRAPSSNPADCRLTFMARFEIVAAH